MRPAAQAVNDLRLEHARPAVGADQAARPLATEVARACAAMAGAGPSVTVAGRDDAITPIKVREIPTFLAALEPAITDLAAGIGLPNLLARHADAIIRATAIGARVERTWLEDQTPTVTAAAERLAQTASGGTNGSPASSMPDSATGT